MRLPDNETPILVCNGASKCGWKPHQYVRMDRTENRVGRLMFECSSCGAERLFGVVDLAQVGRAE